MFRLAILPWSGAYELHTPPFRETTSTAFLILNRCTTTIASSRPKGPTISRSTSAMSRCRERHVGTRSLPSHAVAFFLSSPVRWSFRVQRANRLLPQDHRPVPSDALCRLHVRFVCIVCLVCPWLHAHRRPPYRQCKPKKPSLCFRMSVLGRQSARLTTSPSRAGATAAANPRLFSGGTDSSSL